MLGLVRAITTSCFSNVRSASVLPLGTFSRRSTAILPVMIAILLCPSSNAQPTAHFAGSQSTIPTSALSFPGGIAVDGSGNVYVTDESENGVLKETLLPGGGYAESLIPIGSLTSPELIAVDGSGNVYVDSSAVNEVLKDTLSAGSYTASLIGSGLYSPAGLAVDTNGNVYIVDSGYGQVLKETPSANTYTQSIIFGHLTFPVGAAVDGSGNVYIGDVNNNRILKLTPSAGSYSATTVGSGLIAPTEVAVDGNGSVYASEPNNNRVVKETPSGSSYTESTVGSGLDFPYGVAVDAGGSVYIVDTRNARVLKETLASPDFGSVNIGSPSSTMTLVFSFDAEGTIAAPAVLTQGATGLDFTDAGTGTCTTNGTSQPYEPGDTCTVDLIFTPKAPGPRYGAAELLDHSGNVIATAYIQGTGQGPQLTFRPGTQSTLSLGNLTGPNSIGVDAAGNLYIVEARVANEPGNAIVKETWTGSGYTQTTVATGLELPAGIAVDGAGNVYVVDEDQFLVLKETPTTGGYAQSIPLSNLGNVSGVAVDGSGNLYIAGDLAWKETLSSSGGYVQSTIAEGVSPSGIAVDGLGNIYLSDLTNQRVLKETPSNGSYTQTTVASGLSDPFGLAVDASGDVYIANDFAGQVLEETPYAEGYTQTILASGFLSPSAVGVDPKGNVYVADIAADQVVKLDFADPPSLSFAATPEGHTSSDSPQSVQFQNIGNVALAGSGALSDFTDFLEVPGRGIVPDCAESIALAPAAECNLSLSFTPQSVGQLDGTLTLSDNSLNGNPAIQTIQLSGTGEVAPQISAISPNYGAPAALITITGTNFGPTQGNSTVTVGGAPTYVVSWSNTTIAILVPTRATTGDIVVTAGGVTSNGAAFTFYPYPTISGVSPASGAVGTPVTITGANLLDGEGNGIVTVDGTPATILSQSSTSIQIDVPAGATSGPVTVHANGDTVKSSSSFTVTHPQITGINPNYGAPAALIKISGTGFGATQGSVTVGGAPSYIVPDSWSNTAISILVPTKAATGNIVVTAGAEASNGVPFTFYPYPAIAGVWPVSGPVGTQVTINGTGLLDGEGNGVVTFNGTPAIILSQTGTGILQVEVPAGATTGPISVHANGDTVRTYGDFTVNTSANQRDQP